MPTQVRTDSESTLGDDEEVMIFPLDDIGTFRRQDDEPKKHTRNYITLQERRQLKLGLRKISELSLEQKQMLPLNVLIPHAHVTDKNRKWYNALKKVWAAKDPWAVFHLADLPEHKAIRHRYDPLKKRWHKDMVKVKMEKKSFDRGAMRQCYRLKRLSKFCHSDDWHHAGNYVAKKYMEDVNRSVYFEDVKLQMDAKLWGEEYNRHNPPKKVDIFQMYIIELVDETGSPLYHLEHFIEGEYIKYNSNSGFVEDHKANRFTPQAFSHFTFERSGHELIVVDIQGVGDLYTDPQIHTMDGEQYGDGNLGTRGMALFFSSHECNDICRALGLNPFDLSETEQRAIVEHHTPQMTPSDTQIRGPVEEVVSPNVEERSNLTGMLSNPRSRSLSSEFGSLPEEASEGFPSSESLVLPDADGQLRPQISIESAEDLGSAGDPVSPDSNGPDQQRNRYVSSTSDDYPYDTSEACSSVQSGGSAVQNAERFGLKGKQIRSTSTEVEAYFRDNSDFHLGDSILGQVHHDLAKYHEIGRFAINGDEHNIDWESALFHEEHAANLGVKEAIKTMAHIYLHLPHDVLVSCSVEENEENTNKGVNFMLKSANSNDRAAILYMAKAYETGIGLGTARERDHIEAIDLYQKAIHTQDHDEAGEFDATMSDPNYLLLAKMAELYRAGEFNLAKDPNRSGELYTEAADEASGAMKGRLANKYYMLAEEAWGEVEEE